MKKPTTIAEGENYTALALGDWDDLGDYAYLHPKLNVEIAGKVFVGEALKSSGAEISFQLVPPRTELSFFHKHRLHEEIYLIIKGSGQFQVDNDLFEVREGSLVRVATDGSRTWRNNSPDPMVLMVIQTQQGSLDSHYIADGFRVKES